MQAKQNMTPKLKPLCPPGRSPRYEDISYAEVTLDNGGYTSEGKSLWTLNELLESGNTANPDWKYIELARKCSPINYAMPVQIVLL